MGLWMGDHNEETNLKKSSSRSAVTLFAGTAVEQTYATLYLVVGITCIVMVGMLAVFLWLPFGGGRSAVTVAKAMA